MLGGNPKLAGNMKTAEGLKELFPVLPVEFNIVKAYTRADKDFFYFWITASQGLKSF